MSRLVVVVPLKDGAYEKARVLLRKGPPFELEASDFDRHEVYLTEREVVFVFESAGATATLKLLAKDPSLWKVAAEWEKLMAEKPRKAETAYSWTRPENDEGIFFNATPGPGDSEGGDLFAPVRGAHDQPEPARGLDSP
jgi:hypothetical protein